MAEIMREQLIELLKELFQDGTIKINNEFSNVIVITIEGEEVQVINK